MSKISKLNLLCQDCRDEECDGTECNLGSGQQAHNKDVEKYNNTKMVLCIPEYSTPKVGDIIDVGSDISTYFAKVTRITKCFVFYKTLLCIKWEYNSGRTQVVEERKKLHDRFRIFPPHTFYYKSMSMYDYRTVYVQNTDTERSLF